MKNIRFQCANCKTRYVGRAEQSGKLGACKTCGKEIVVPKLEIGQFVAESEEPRSVV